MIQKYHTINQIFTIGVVGILRKGNDPSLVMSIIQACLKGGLSLLEVTFTQANAHIIIEQVRTQYPDCVIGAGTVLDSETARIAILSGARYVVSPMCNVNIAKMCNRYGIPYIAGCSTPTEMMQAMEWGVDIIKLFPSVEYSPSIIKTYKAPLPQANFMPTGGITLDNAADWIQAGAVAIGVGGDLTAGINATTQDGFDEQVFSAITDKAQAYINVVAKAKSVTHN